MGKITKAGVAWHFVMKKDKLYSDLREEMETYAEGNGKGKAGNPSFRVKQERSDLTTE